MEDILNLMAWSGSSAMGTSLMAGALDKKEDELSEQLKEAVTAGSLKETAKKGRYEITPETRKERRDNFPLTGGREWVTDICRRLGDWFDERRKDPNIQPAYEAEMDHLKEWAGHVKPFSIFHAARLTWLQAYPPYFRGKFEEALKQVQAAQSLLDGAPDTETGTEEAVRLKANLFHDLAAVYDELKNADEALKNYRLALELQEKHFGRQHEDTADTISNIAAAYDRMGNREEAITYFEEALEIRRKLFGEEHEETASSINNIGTSYYEAKRYSDAIFYLEKAVEIRLKVLGHEHPDTADSLYNLGICLVNIKRLKTAYERVNPFLKKLSPDHPNYNELVGLLAYIDKESVKSGFRPMSSVSSKKKKKKKKKKR